MVGGGGGVFFFCGGELVIAMMANEACRGSGVVVVVGVSSVGVGLWSRSLLMVLLA